MIFIFADGSCRGNPGPGGWGTLVQIFSSSCSQKKILHSKELWGYEAKTTNNRMEMQGVIQGLSYVEENFCTWPLQERTITIVSDSQYVVKGIKEWVPLWQKNGWKTAQKKTVENQDLWQALLEGSSQLEKKWDALLQWQWVRGHDGHLENERVNILAQKASHGAVSEDLMGRKI